MKRSKSAKISEFSKEKIKTDKTEAALSGIKDEVELQELKQDLISLHLQNEQIAELLPILEAQKAQMAESSEEKKKVEKHLESLKAIFRENEREIDDLTGEIRDLSLKVFHKGK